MTTDSQPTGQQQSQFFGEYIAKVESVSDPDNLMRVQVRVYGVFTDNVPKADLPWAEYKLPIGVRVNDGFFTPVDVNDYVWVDFPYSGDPRRPRITGGVHHAPGKVPNLPHEAFAGSQKLTHKTTGEEPAPSAAEYHKNVVYTQHGITIEMNVDHSFTVTQRATGTAIRVSPEGDITLHSEKNIFASAIENLKAIFEGNAQIKVTGKTELISMGKMDLDGGSGDLSGVVTMLCICPFTGKPHSDYSSEVKASKG
jgi:hypothetical protein